MDNIKGKIAGLLAKAERTSNEHERDVFNAKAEALMLKYGLEQAELQAAGEVKPEDIIEVKLEFTGIYAVVMPSFVHTIARAMGNVNVLQGTSWDKKTRYAYVIGHKSDVESATMLINSLQMQAMSAMKRWWKTHDQKAWMSSMEQYKARRQFVLSFSTGAGERIKSERKVHEETATPGAALVLVSKQERVDSWMHQNHVVSRARRGAHGSFAGRAEGQAAGRQANVGTTGIGGSHKALK